MKADIDSASFVEFASTFTSPLERASIAWRSSWTLSGVPSLAQSDQSSIYDHSLFCEDVPSKTDEEKQQDDLTRSDCSASNTEEHVAEPSPPSMSRTREAAFIFITCVSQFLSLSALNQTVAPVLVLAEYFNVDNYGTLSWFSASFSMSVGTFILPAGTFTACTTAVCSSPNSGQACTAPYPQRFYLQSLHDRVTERPTSHSIGRRCHTLTQSH
jgi:hypothetical protein